mmetsp:Transcript_34781/g.63318  ORF Transcript_34781/g.63318 Transcript_34781/m.63318 type:complete len:208 (+) Transcript_34781:1110-1733(+)
MTSLMKGSAPAFSQSLCKVSVSRASNSCSLASWDFLARALSTPPSSCHWVRSFSTRAAFASVPVMPMFLQRVVNSGSDTFSSSCFFATTIALISASCASASARTFSSCWMTASIMSSFLPSESPELVTSALMSSTGLDFSSFLLVFWSSVSSTSCTGSHASSVCSASSLSTGTSSSLALALRDLTLKREPAEVTALRFWIAMMSRYE